MLRNQVFRILFVVLAAVSLFGVEAAQATTRVKGTLYSVDRASNTVTLKSDGILTTIHLSSGTRFVRNGERSSLTNFVLGDRITTVYKTSLYPSKLKASGPAVSQLQGRIQNVTPSGMVQIDGLLYGTGAKTRIVRNGSVASLDSLATGDDAIAHVDDSGEIEDIQCEGPDEAETYGTITAIDTTAGTLSFQDLSGNLVTVTVSIDTMIEAGDMAATLADLTVGMLVEVHYDPITFAAYRIEAEDEGEDAEIEGTITAVDAVNGTVTIQDALGVSVTVIVEAGTRIERDGEPAYLSDLMAGDAGEAEYDVNTFIAEEVESESPETGDDSSAR